jgi:hypothetical protein
MRGLFAGLGAVVAAAVLVVACDGREQSRPLNYRKGTYLGNPDEGLSAATLEGLRQRAAYQAFGSDAGGASSSIKVGSSGTNVRPPSYADNTGAATRPAADGGRR